MAGQSNMIQTAGYVLLAAIALWAPLIFITVPVDQGESPSAVNR